MPKVRKLKRSKKFKANVNRKRLRNKLNKLPAIECKQIKEAWESRKSISKNLYNMGLAANPNKLLKIPSSAKDMLQITKNEDENKDDTIDEKAPKRAPRNVHVAQSLEEDARHPRVRLFRLPNNDVQFVTYMMDKYGDDYKAMVRDRKNYNQLTWRQIKNKIEKFKKVPEQYAEYLVSKGEIIFEQAPLEESNMDRDTVVQI